MLKPDSYYNSLMDDLDRRFNTLRPMTSSRELLDQPMPEPPPKRIPLVERVVEMPKPKAKRAPRAKATAPGYLGTKQAATLCPVTGRAHQWKPYAPTTGTQQARCLLCMNRTTMHNAGLSTRTRGRLANLTSRVPWREQPPCVEGHQHHWFKFGTKRGVQQLRCSNCRRQTREAAPATVPLLEAETIPGGVFLPPEVLSRRADRQQRV